MKIGVIPKRNELFAFACLQACCLILLFAIVVKSQWLILGVLSDSFFPNWLLIGFDLTILLSSIVIAKRNVGFAICFLAIVFSGFSFFHFYNLGKPCGCFGATYSTWISVMLNISIAMGLAIVWFVEKLSYALLGMFLCIASVGMSLYLVSPRTNLSIVNFCDFVSEQQPFTLINTNSPDFSKGNWEVFVLERDCEKCCSLAADLLGDSLFLADLVLNAKAFAVYQGESADFWEVANVRHSDLVRVIPVQLTIQNGKIIRCKKGRELFRRELPISNLKKSTGF